MKFQFPMSPNGGVPDFDKLKDELLNTLNSLPMSKYNTFQNRVSALGALEGERAIWTRAISRFNQVNKIGNINPTGEARYKFVLGQAVSNMQNADDNFWKNNKDLDPNYNYSQEFLASRMDNKEAYANPAESESPYRYVVSLLGNNGPVWKDVNQETYNNIQSDQQPIKDTERFFSGVNSDSPQQKYNDLVNNFNSGNTNGI